MGGVSRNLVTFHSPSFKPESNASEPGSRLEACKFGVMTSSDTEGMLLRLMVSDREIRVIPKVALRRGSSQQGNARRAAVGSKGCQERSVNSSPSTHLKLCQSIVLRFSILFICRFIVSHHATSQFTLERDLEGSLRSCREGAIDVICHPLRSLIKSLFAENLLNLRSIRVQ